MPHVIIPAITIATNPPMRRAFIFFDSSDGLGSALKFASA
jgi:hypothetical protein